MQPDSAPPAAVAEAELLRGLAADLRAAIDLSLRHGFAHLAVALDTARDLLETVLAEPAPKSTRVAIARTRAEIALEVWREALEAGRR